MRLTGAVRTCVSTALVLGAFITGCGGSSEPPPAIANLTLSPVADTLRIGETTQLSAIAKDANDNVLTGRPTSWTSSSSAIATVSATGLVTGVSDGAATITVSSETRSASATIQVFGPCRTLIAPTLSVGQTVNGSLANTDCRLTDGTYADGYSLVVTAPTTVQIDMTASSFDTFLILLELLTDSLAERAVNDDIDPDDELDPNDPVDTNSRIVFTLQPNLQYFVLANSYAVNTFGNYQLKVAAVAPVAGASRVVKPGKASITSLLKVLKAK